jgi:hypothetical protein
LPGGSRSRGFLWQRGGWWSSSSPRLRSGRLCGSTGNVQISLGLRPEGVEIEETCRELGSSARSIVNGNLKIGRILT